MIQYGSCPRGCGAQVAWMSEEPGAPLDPNEFVPHLCAAPEGPLQQAVDDAEARRLEELAVYGPRGNPHPQPKYKAVRLGIDEPLAKSEREADRYQQLQRAADLIIKAIGEDPDRDGLKDTPDRFARMWIDFIHGATGDEDHHRTFEHQSTNQMVIVHGIRVWSMCEHHLLPFWMDVAVAYISRDKVIGLSKIGRIARHCAARLGMQERYVEQVADVITKVSGTDDVMVSAEGQHLCMLSRGARMDHTMVSSAARGLFLEAGNAARNEFLHFTSRGRRHA